MSRVTQSISQVLTTFGPGAMMDLPTRSVVVAGLDHWDGHRAAFGRIEEPRLQLLLQTQLVANNRWVPNRPLHLRTPPIAQETRQDADPASVSVRIFPTWFTCEGVPDPAGGSTRRRRLVPWGDLDAGSGRAKYQREDGKKVEVTPVRFVGACEKGHLQDIDWRWLVHRGASCGDSMWIEEEGTSADPANIRIGCLCGRPAVSLADAFKPGFLGKCGGRRPWLDSNEGGCTENLHFLSRSATNTYFAQTVTVISLPIPRTRSAWRSANTGLRCRTRRTPDSSMSFAMSRRSARRCTGTPMRSYSRASSRCASAISMKPRSTPRSRSSTCWRAGTHRSAAMPRTSRCLPRRWRASISIG
jgi:hypothetical protein